jgi:hypothetical protein
MIAKKIYESPDTISLPNLEYNEYGEDIHSYGWSPSYDDSDSHPFWIEGGELVLGEARSLHPLAIKRNKRTYSGRLWAKKKLISFWVYPDRDKFIEIANGLSQKLEEEYGSSFNILEDSEWKVEILPVKNWFSKRGKPFKTELVPVMNYKESASRSEGDLGQDHIKSPLLKQKKIIPGFGSSNPKYIEKRRWQMAAPLGESNKNINMKKLVYESLEELLEGVGDKYAERRWGIPDEESRFEAEFSTKTSGNSVGTAKGFDIIKNPTSLAGYPQGSRAVITKSGDLYVVPDVENVIHTDILAELKRKRVVVFKSTGWEEPDKTPEIDFITVQRVWTKPVFAIGESYFLPKPKFPEERVQALKFFEPFLEAARKKNPQYKFINEQIRKIAKEILSPAEYEKFKYQGS